MREYARAWMVVRLERMGTESDSPLPDDEVLDVESLVESFGHAMNAYELRESLPDFLMEGALQVLAETCGHDRALAGTLLGNAIAEAVEGKRTF